ncbi:MAG: hypothetical protein WC533_01695 [Candidatus Pacearchaeota archaeon]
MIKHKGFKYNFLVMSNMANNQINLNGKKVAKEDFFVLKYEGASFDNHRMELHSFSKQITAVEKMLKETINTLSEKGKIKDTAKETKYYLECRQGSFETIIFILFANPVVTGVVSNCIYDYFKYMVSKVKSPIYTKEVESMINNKVIRKSTKDVFSPCVTSSDKVTIIHGDVTNNILMGEKEREKIESHIKEIEEKLPIQEYEQELIGQIKKLDGVKAEGLDDLSKMKLGFVIEGQQEAIDINFTNQNIQDKEIRKLIFKRLKIKCKSTYRGEEITKILVESYKLSPIKKITEY